MPVGIGLKGERAPHSRADRSHRFTGPAGFHVVALGLATAAPLLATLLLIARIAA